VNRVDQAAGTAQTLVARRERTVRGVSPFKAVGIGVALSMSIIEDSENDALIVVRLLRQGRYDIDNERVDSHAGLCAHFVARRWGYTS
jgi:hypothetical protein